MLPLSEDPAPRVSAVVRLRVKRAQSATTCRDGLQLSRYGFVAFLDRLMLIFKRLQLVCGDVLHVGLIDHKERRLALRNVWLESAHRLARRTTCLLCQRALLCEGNEDLLSDGLGHCTSEVRSDVNHSQMDGSSGRRMRIYAAQCCMLRLDGALVSSVVAV